MSDFSAANVVHVFYTTKLLPDFLLFEICFSLKSVSAGAVLGVGMSLIGQNGVSLQRFCNPSFYTLKYYTLW